MFSDTAEVGTQKTERKKRKKKPRKVYKMKEIPEIHGLDCGEPQDPPDVAHGLCNRKMPRGNVTTATWRGSAHKMTRQYCRNAQYMSKFDVPGLYVKKIQPQNRNVVPTITHRSPYKFG